MPQWRWPREAQLRSHCSNTNQDEEWKLRGLTCSLTRPQSPHLYSEEIGLDSPYGFLFPLQTVTDTVQVTGFRNRAVCRSYSIQGLNRWLTWERVQYGDVRDLPQALCEPVCGSPEPAPQTVGQMSG